MPILGYSIRTGVEDLPVLNDVVARYLELLDDLDEELSMLADRKSLDVFEDEIACVQLANDPHEVLHQ
ncbi:hypothetical protein XGA_0292 [Xanthomonas hortorum ATCC 19865]|nr:hypothetical protein XJ27_18870 [Xanthomonas hortorum]EGD21008.1 hypothetical protein XGA_0292 [Xanthomonas hortorum ATCC 19865]